MQRWPRQSHQIRACPLLVVVFIVLAGGAFSPLVVLGGEEALPVGRHPSCEQAKKDLRKTTLMAAQEAKQLRSDHAHVIAKFASEHERWEVCGPYDPPRSSQPSHDRFHLCISALPVVRGVALRVCTHALATCRVGQRHDGAKQNAWRTPVRWPQANTRVLQEQMQQLKAQLESVRGR